MSTGLKFRSISLFPKSDHLLQSRKKTSWSEHQKAHRGNLSWLSLVIHSFQYYESWFMFYIGLLLKMTLFHQPISKFLPFPKGLALKEICWSLLYYIHVISIFRIAPLFFSVLIHNKYSFLLVVVFFSSENNFCLLQQPCILENILFLVFYCMFGKMIISLPLPVNTKIIFCCQRKKKKFFCCQKWTIELWPKISY